MRNLILVLIVIFAFAKAGTAQSKSVTPQLSGPELIAKSIAFHDPDGNWEQFSGEFTLALEMPEKPVRKSMITLDLTKQYFNVTTEQDGKTSYREISKDQCRFSDEEGEGQETTVDDEACERTKMFRNYYSYLYGLPMKLTDLGTNIEEQVTRKTMNGKEYLVARVTYDEAVGSDIWQFYFDPQTYAMEVYQFFKGADEKTGEYILLSGISVVDGIKMPKDRAWYYNKDGGYLATDKMVEH